LTLRLYGPGDLDRLDPVAARPDAAQLVRLVSRQLLSYAPRRDLREWQSVLPAPDVALDVPSTYNAGLGASQRSYVVHLRRDVYWDTSPPRPVTAHDFVRGFKRLANPLTRSPALPFFRSTVRGFAEFCDGFANARPTSAEAAAAYQNAHEISGIFALDDESLVIEVVRASPDFVHMLALPCTSAVPQEHDAHLPGSPDLTPRLCSNGPYRVGRHVPGKELRLEPNPVWSPDADPVRRRPIDAVVVTRADTDAGEVAARLDAGGADLPWGIALSGEGAAPAAALSWDLDPYLVFNLTTGSDALRDVAVRRGITAAIDRDALARTFATAGCRAASGVVPPNNDGHRPPSADDRGTGGDLGGLTLTGVHERCGPHALVARACADQLARVGVQVRLFALDRPDLDELVRDPHGSAAPRWDVMWHRCCAAWHYRNGRVFLEQMFASGAPGNLGGWSDEKTDALVERALEAAVEAPAVATAAWHEVERHVLEQAVVVPLLFRPPAVPPRSSARVRDAVPMPALGYACDITAIRVADAALEEVSA